jgi:ABC-type antimicrobial peptide transport system permease subunit
MYDYDYYLVNNNTIKYNLITSSKDLSIYSNDKLKSLNDFRNLNLNIKDSYEYSKSNYKEAIKESNTSTLIISGIMLLISLIEMFLMIRSSFLSRIKEIGIFRAIGVKRIDIYKMFYGEIFAITTLTSVPGLLFMAYVLSILREIKMLERLFLVNTATILISILLVYVFNLLIGLIPVFNVVRKTPAQILSRHDLD